MKKTTSKQGERSTDGPGKNSEPARKPTFLFREVPANFAAAFRSQASTPSADIDKLCTLLEQVANDQVATRCKGREFAVESLVKPCTTTNKETSKPVDLVVLIDTSGSMVDEATAVSAAADAAISAASARCASDLRVVWLGLEGTFAGTKFTTTLRDYLHGLGVADSAIRHRIGYTGQEDGGRGIEDVAHHFDWRPGAARAMLFLGDEPLDAGEPQNPDDVAAANNAITAANTASMTVFMYAGTGIEAFFDGATRAIDEYARVATSTGGIAYSATAGNLANFELILEEIICAAGSGTCQTPQLPGLRPCLTLRWGDGPTDRMETDDVEILCFTMTNPYTNVTFSDVMLYLLILDPTFHRPSLLPDGTPSVQVKPDVLICFGTLGSCGAKQGEPSGASREVVLINRGAAQGQYYVLGAYCYRVDLHLAFASIFPLDITKS
jgi:hypothetical protein